jgi:nickel transport protein
VKRNTHCRFRPYRLLVVAAIAAFVTAPQRAEAHDLKVLISLEGDPLRLEAWFDDDTPAEKARVTVSRDSGEEVLAGETDDRGVWLFAKPGPGSYRIVVESVGHRDVLKLDIPGIDSNGAPVAVGDPRLEPRVGLFIGLALVLGGTLVFVLLRLKKRTPETP